VPLSARSNVGVTSFLAFFQKKSLFSKKKAKKRALERWCNQLSCFFSKKGGSLSDAAPRVRQGATLNPRT
jgi:hypothetical protein